MEVCLDYEEIMEALSTKRNQIITEDLQYALVYMIFQPQ